MKKNKYIANVALIMLALFVGVMCSCRDDDDVVTNNTTINEKDAEKIIDSAITEWGISMEQVTQQMNNYSLVTSQNNDFLMFSNKTETCHFSYKFINDSLYCALVIMPQLAENADLGNMLRGYSYIGELNNVTVYQNKGEDILACTYEYEEDDVGYQALGFTPINSEMSAFALMSTEGITAGHEWVDLGLSVKWATCNVGAEFPEDYGGYYAWGETEGKSIYSWPTYKHGRYTSMAKYCTNSRYGTVDGKNTLDSEDDAATASWGSPWRMPTLDEMKELIDDCTWSWITQNGVNGYRVIGPNGNSIFLPASGFRRDTEVYNCGSRGEYWLSTLDEDVCHYAYSLNFRSGSHDLSYFYRSIGHTVRPVTE